MARDESKIVLIERFADYVFDEDYQTYLLLGGYGSGKSHQTAAKIVLRSLERKTKSLVVRATYTSIEESCFELIKEILEGMNLLVNDDLPLKVQGHKVIERRNPFGFKFPNGSRIIMRGMDNPERIKSIHNLDLVWLEECSEISYKGYKELLLRLRTSKPMYLLTCNPVGKENWTYQHFFVRLDNEGREQVIMDPEKLYEKRTVVKRRTYYHHSLPDDNPYLEKDYFDRLDDLKHYDRPLWRVARWGRFGAAGMRVLPQFQVAKNAKNFVNAVKAIDPRRHYYGMDFGFEESSNAVVSMAVDLEKSILYVYDEIYQNKVTDDQFALHPKMKQHRARSNVISADNEDPKAIAYYNQQGFKMRQCYKARRIDNTRKMKRFKKIIVSPKCKNVIRELKDLTYKVDQKGNVIYDQFNIDPHTFSAMWYGLDQVTVANVKDRKSNSRKGEETKQKRRRA